MPFFAESFFHLQIELYDSLWPLFNTLITLLFSLSLPLPHPLRLLNSNLLPRNKLEAATQLSLGSHCIRLLVRKNEIWRNDNNGLRAREHEQIGQIDTTN